MHKICFVIPIYNHHEFIENTVKNLSVDNHDLFLIDDGSNEICKEVLKNIAEKEERYHLITLPKNKGKGVAVIAGFQEAFNHGFTHALQIDADGQHDFTDIPAFIERSKQYPEELISGWPIYDNSIPKARLYGRYITHFWVWVETLSFDIKDSMCGFRIYPLSNTMNLINNSVICKRMDFDTDIMVKLYWKMVPLYFIRTKVNYPKGGVSHFKSFSDNWLISKMHIYLFFGMLKRIPSLLKNKQ